MNSDFSASEELSALLTSMTEGRLDESESERLNHLVQHEPEARQFYLDYVSLHVMLNWHHGSAPVLDIPLDPPDLSVDSSKSARPVWAGLAVAALLLVAVTLAIVIRSERGPLPPQPEPLAILLEDDNAQWDTPDGQPESEALAVGKQRLAAGVARLQLSSGVIVALRGPVEFEILPDNHFGIQRGVMRAYVPPEAQGFTVRAPGVEVVDLGTEFGVAVNESDDVQVHVFQGVVRVNLQIDVKANQALYIDHKAYVKRIKLQGKTFPSIHR